MRRCSCRSVWTLPRADASRIRQVVDQGQGQTDSSHRLITLEGRVSGQSVQPHPVEGGLQALNGPGEAPDVRQRRP